MPNSRKPSQTRMARKLVLLKSANELDKCSFGFLINPEIKTMKHMLKPEVTAQVINRCLSHHIS
jgi:hypothetical protein